jgi:hypothetical protein
MPVVASERWRHWLPWALCALGLAGVAACVALDVLDRARIHSFHDAQPLGIVLPVSFSLLGAVIVSQQPENRIGWIYLLIGVVMPIQSVTTLYYLRSVHSGGCRVRAGPRGSRTGRPCSSFRPASGSSRSCSSRTANSRRRAGALSQTPL